MLIFLFCSIFFSFYGCNDVEENPVAPKFGGCDFLLLAKEQTIRRFPGTGGKFEILILPGSKLTEPIKLFIESESCIGATLNKFELTEDDVNAEVNICTPSSPLPTKHTIVVKAFYNGVETRLNLYLEIVGWDEIRTFGD
jgi:hypothetical protein